MMNIPPSDELQQMLDKRRLLREPLEARMRHFDEGTPALLSSEEMDIQNSLQVASAGEHIICKQADFELAHRFMQENPHRKGFQFMVQ